jgi:hypothetical protein
MRLPCRVSLCGTCLHYRHDLPQIISPGCLLLKRACVCQPVKHSLTHSLFFFKLHAFVTVGYLRLKKMASFRSCMDEGNHTTILFSNQREFTTLFNFTNAPTTRLPSIIQNTHYFFFKAACICQRRLSSLKELASFRSCMHEGNHKTVLFSNQREFTTLFNFTNAPTTRLPSIIQNTHSFFFKVACIYQRVFR